MSKSYLEFIESAKLFERVETTLTGGDVDYNGTALEVNSEKGEELFHVVVDSKGEQQVLIFRGEGNYRIPLKIFNEIIEVSRKKVNALEDDEQRTPKGSVQCFMIQAFNL